MPDLTEMLETYIGYSSLREYYTGDYALRYHRSFGSICLIQAKRPISPGAYHAHDWENIHCASLGPRNNIGRTAGYLGECVSKVSYRPSRNLPLPDSLLPQVEDPYFDNITFFNP